MKGFLRQTLGRRRDQAPERGPAGGAAGKTPFAAVAIEPGLISCSAVDEFRGQRMLEKDAPSLPVAGCDQSRCSCRYVKFVDRRSGEDRRAPFSNLQLETLRMSCKDLRERPDRRVGGKAERAAKPRAYFNNYD